MAKRATGKFERLRYLDLQRASQMSCGYLRSPELLGDYVVGKCALTRKNCEGRLPQITEDCETYKKWKKI